MKKNKTLLLLIFFIPLLSFEQKKTRFSLEINYGLNGNFSVPNYIENSGPADKLYLLRKKFLGTVAGADLKYALNKRSGISLAFSRAINKGPKAVQGPIGNVFVVVQDFQLRSIGNYFQVYYERDFSKNLPDLRYQIGIIYATLSEQELLFENFDNLIYIEERNFKNSYLEEGGFLPDFSIQNRLIQNSD